MTDTMKTEQQTAYNLYAIFGNSIERIAEAMKLETSTVAKWARENKWQETIDTLNNTPGRLSAEYYKECSNIISEARATKRALNDDEVNRMNKLIATANKVDYEQSPRVQMEIMMKFIDYLFMRDPDMAKQLAEQAMGYARHLMTRTKKMNMKSKKN